MEKILIKAEARPEKGKGSARSMRRMGAIPAVMYSGGESTPIKIDTKEMSKLIVSGVAEHALLTVALGSDGSEHPVLVKDYQRDPVSEELLHVDFFKVSLQEKVTVTVPVELTKKPVGVKMGGTLEHKIRELEVECLPTNIPDSIEVNAENVQIGKSFRVGDLPEIEGVIFTADESAVILSVKAAKTAAAIEEEEAEAAAAAAEPTEPEVAGKGKEAEESEKAE